MSPVDLDAVKPSDYSSLSCFTEGLYNIVDLFWGESACFAPFYPILGRTCPVNDAVYSGMVKLGYDFPIILMNFVCEFPQFWNMIFIANASHPSMSFA